MTLMHVNPKSLSLLTFLWGWLSYPNSSFPEQEFILPIPVALQSSVDTLALQEGEWGLGQVQ